MPRLRVHSFVELELNEAHAWYAERSLWAAENFRAAFDRTLHRIDMHPTAHALWRSSIFRRSRVRDFPYIVLFHATRRLISVLALVHQRRDPALVLKTTSRRFARFA